MGQNWGSKKVIFLIRDIDGVGGGRVGRDIVDEGGVHADVDVDY